MPERQLWLERRFRFDLRNARLRVALVIGLGMACSPTAPRQTVFTPAPPGGGPALEQRLGYPRGTRLLILHFDDLGVTRSANAAVRAARDSGLVVSGSVIVPGRFFQEVAAYARAHPDFDLGIHVSLTSEFPGYRWGPVSPKSSVASLLAGDSLFRREWTDTSTIRWQDVERELVAQIGAARASGIRLTHLDVHEFVLYSRGPILLEILRRVARDEALPLLGAREWISGRRPMRKLPSGELELSRVVSIAADVSPADWNSYYTEQMRALPPGVSELILHPVTDSIDAKSLTAERVNWGAAWRARDWAFVASPAFRRLLREEKIHLITWRQLDSLLAAAPSGP
jgi:predicted glycoside hydrolase/deacetylase ChbG (UPF0249 family)